MQGDSSAMAAPQIGKAQRFQSRLEEVEPQRARLPEPMRCCCCCVAIKLTRSDACMLLLVSSGYGDAEISEVGSMRRRKPKVAHRTPRSESGAHQAKGREAQERTQEGARCPQPTTPTNGQPNSQPQ